MEIEQKIADLVDKLYNGTISDLESEFLFDWYNSFDDTLYELPDKFARNEQEWRVRMSVNLDKRIKLSTSVSKKISFFSNWSNVAAIFLAFILLGSALGYLFWNKWDHIQYGASNINVAPGGNNATLTLSDGQKIDLSTAENGLIASIGDVEVRKSNTGDLYYQSGYGSSKELLYSKLETPNGGQFHLVLSDGTQVWLNAASQLRFPQQFIGEERQVFLEGEAYFDVKHSNKPFRVTSNGQDIKVLGTAFNVNTYKDEPYLLTTLVRGSVKVVANDRELLLEPGDQSFAKGDILGQRKANIETSLAWRNGKLSFVDADIREIMRQVGRWYNLDIVYPNGVPNGKITGGISRNSNLQDLLKILEYSKLRFRLEEKSGRKVLYVLL